MADSAMVFEPVHILFYFTQKQFIQGIAVTALKS